MNSVASLDHGFSIDGVLVQWGDRLFYPGNRMVKAAQTPRFGSDLHCRAAAIRRRIEATVAKRAPQVMVKVTGGGRGMGAIAAHFRYISKNGRLAFEDDRGVVEQGREALHDLAEQWRFGGSLIGETSPRREAYNLMLSMPRGTDAQSIMRAAREFAQVELSDHRYVMVLHEHQENPHVHLSVRAESMGGKRLNPRKSDLHRWRETFAEKLRGCGVEAEATRQASRGEGRRFESVWQIKARKDGRLRGSAVARKSGESYHRSRMDAIEAWAQIVTALRSSDQTVDHTLAHQVVSFIGESDFARMHCRVRGYQTPDRTAANKLESVVSRGWASPEIER